MKISKNPTEQFRYKINETVNKRKIKNLREREEITNEVEKLLLFA